jgi:hypothetical protein
MKEININEKWNDSGQVHTQRVGYAKPDIMEMGAYKQ